MLLHVMVPTFERDSRDRHNWRFERELIVALYLNVDTPVEI